MAWPTVKKAPTLGCCPKASHSLGPWGRSVLFLPTIEKLAIMTRKILLLLSCVAGIALAQAQKPEDIVFSVNGQPVTLEEFRYIYEKNNAINKDEQLYTKASLDEYLKLYINFKLKVQEAKAQGMDTSEKFKKEFDTYRNQLAQPYLHDKEVSESLVKEAYERMKWELRASHILIDLAPDAYPSDTLKAYNLAMEAYKKIKAGADFAETAVAYADYTKDPTLRERGGDLGYFTVFNMIYEFESACYEAAVGEVIKPVRTKYGYHVIMVTDKRPYQGEMTAAHIMIRTDLNNTEDEEKVAKAKIDSIYLRLQQGEKFDDLARVESQHYASASQGGRLRSFNALATWLPQEIIAQSYALANDGDISAPFKTEYGWHVAQRISLVTLKSYDELKEDLRRKVERDTRAQRSTKAALKRIKKENRFKAYPKTLKIFTAQADSAVINAKWVPREGVAYNKVMCRIGKRELTQLDFANYVVANQKEAQFSNPGFAMEYLYERFEESQVFQYENERLELKYPEFKNIVREYYEGILLFEVTDNEVWTRAMKDTLGQRAFYNDNLNQYQWKERAEAIIFYCRDKKVAEEIQSKLLPDNSNLNELYKTMNQDNSMTFSYVQETYEEGQEEVLGLVEWSVGFKAVENFKDRYALIKFVKVLPPQPKKLSEIKGLVIADYQDHLEKSWIDSLQKKFPVQVNQALIDQLVK